MMLAIPAAAFAQQSRQGEFAVGVAAYDRRDYQAAYEAWLPLARNDDAAAQRNLGQLFRFGQGVEQDFAEAAKWYGRAADLGLPSAQANLAALLLNGQGVPRDVAGAARLYEAAARQGLALAQHNLGLIHYNGEGLPRNEAVGLGWLNLAAKSGYQPALDALSGIVQGQAPPALAAVSPPPGVPSSVSPPAPGPPAADKPAPGPPAADKPAPGPPAADKPAPGPPAADKPALTQPSPAQGPPPSDWWLTDFVGRLFGLTADPPPAPTAAYRVEQQGEPAAEREGQYWAALAAFQIGDVATARRGWLTLAEQGSAEAQYRLAQSHLRNDLASADRAEGLYWLLRAEAQGHGEATAALVRMAAEGGPELAAARTRLRAWRGN